MFKKATAFLLIAALLVSSVDAGKSYSGSSSSSSSSRSSSSGSSRSSSSSSRPSSGFGSSSSSSSNKSSSSSWGGSSKSYSGGSSTPSTPSSSYKPSVSTPKSYSTPPTSSYSPKPSAPSYSTPPPSSKPSGGSWFSGATSSAAKAESQKKYVASTTPKPTYKTPGPSGVEKPLRHDAPEVQTVRRYVTHERYVTYDNRATTFYGGYQPTYYHDHFSPFLTGYLLGNALSSHDRALWVYHHRDSMDDARYKEMLAKDAKLQAELDLLKAQNLARDPAYVPAAMKENPDLMYNKEFVDASFNPTATVTEHKEESSGWGWVIFFVLLIGFVFATAMFIAWASKESDNR